MATGAIVFFGLGDYKHSQLCRLQQPSNVMLRPESMTPEINENTAFAKWFREWTAIIHKHRAPAERIPANMTSTNEEEHSDGVRLVGPKHGSGKADSCSRS